MQPRLRAYAVRYIDRRLVVHARSGLHAIRIAAERLGVCYYAHPYAWTVQEL